MVTCFGDDNASSEKLEELDAEDEAIIKLAGKKGYMTVQQSFMSIRSQTWESMRGSKGEGPAKNTR